MIIYSYVLVCICISMYYIVRSCISMMVCIYICILHDPYMRAQSSKSHDSPGTWENPNGMMDDNGENSG